jgi:hypothetical protein
MFSGAPSPPFYNDIMNSSLRVLEMPARFETLYPTLISSPTPPLFPDSPVVDDASEEDKSPHNKSILIWRHTIYTTLWAFVLLEAKT